MCLDIFYLMITEKPLIGDGSFNFNFNFSLSVSMSELLEYTKKH
jgi:hypothetical protein